MIHLFLYLQVLELLTHISKRIKSRPNVPLPLISLLSVFTDTHQPPQVTVSNQC